MGENKKVTGVLKYNIDIRNRHLMTTMGRYAQFKEPFDMAIGEAYGVENRSQKPISSVLGLYQYTHGRTTDYGNKIEDRYFLDGMDKDVYSTNDAEKKSTYLHWFGMYGDYINHVSSTYGVDRYEGISEKVAESPYSEVGAIHSPDVARALDGNIVTNPNRQSVDTELGILSSSYFGKHMYKGSVANGERDRSNMDWHPYITPNLQYLYGNNPDNISKFEDGRFAIQKETGRLAGDLSDVRIIDDYNLDEIDNNGGVKFLITHMDVNEQRHALSGMTRTIYTPDGFLSMNGSSEALASIVNDMYGNVSGPYIDMYGAVSTYVGTWFHVSEGFSNHQTAGGGQSARIENVNYFEYDEGDLPSMSATEYTNAEITNFANNLFNSAKTSLKNLFRKKKNWTDYQWTTVEGEYYSPSSINEGNEWGTFTTEITQNQQNGLLYKTNRLFKEHKIGTLIGRFHTSSDIEENDVATTTDTAKTSFGNSYGRNLLRRKKDYELSKTVNGYDNPYCRVWTYHSQYMNFDKLIRPFVMVDGYTTGNDSGFKRVQSINDDQNYRSKIDGLENGGEYLYRRSVLQDNGLVNITPKTEDLTNARNNSDDGRKYKKYMFSLENLAWKDVPKIAANLSSEQIGLNGGRIMWFPPYDLNFQESVSVNWNSSNFIGRGEAVNTYANTTRSGTLSFTILVDHPAIVNSFAQMDDNDASEYDLDADILRYFAGCGLPTLKTPPKVEKVIENEEPAEPTDEPVEEKSPEITTKKMCVYVFFPNNYSGNFTAQHTVGCSDYDWAEYLLCGQGMLSEVSEEEKERIGSCGHGYEMGNGTLCDVSGNTFYPDVYDTNGGNMYISAVEGYGAPVCGIGRNTDCYKATQSATTVDGKVYIKPKHTAGTKYYKYRVDYDFHQKLRYDKNYVITDDYGLNVDKEKVIEMLNIQSGTGSASTAYSMSAESPMLASDGDMVFGSDIDTDVETDKIDIPETEEADTDNCPCDEVISFYSFMKGLYKFAGKEGTGCDSCYTDDYDAENVYEILKKCSNGEIDAKVTKVAGCATSTDSKNSKTLASRRSDSIIWLLARYNVKIDEELTPSYLTGDAKSTTDVSDGNSVKNRYAMFELTYGPKEVEEEEEETVEEETEEEEKETVTNLEPFSSQNRYETEAEYFKRIQLSDPVIFRKLKEKYKYFDPGFHSISPEGFNARLTFLQQCTRQGHTVAATDNTYGMANSAGNLAFGRMPVCVLRIGDFINTRIIINSMSISYGDGGMQWDLNPEGIGVQPMLAKVNLGITILGGQSLDGPISRLQNAVSFNYYANAPVYDDRADRIKYTSNGDGTFEQEYERLWSPVNDYSDESEYHRQQRLNGNYNSDGK